MNALPLDPAGYAGSYKLVGGRPALDLVNTVSWPSTDREHDWLAIPANVGLWLDAIGLDSPRVSDEDLPAVHEVRRVVADLLRPLARGEHPTLAVVDRFNRFLRTSLDRRRIDPGDLTWTWAPARDARESLDPVVLDAAELATANDRIKPCPSCDWLFEDQTRNGQRRWCDMADCGSRAKARRYYHRHKE